jgi:hypothetical protein
VSVMDSNIDSQMERAARPGAPLMGSSFPDRGAEPGAGVAEAHSPQKH